MLTSHKSASFPHKNNFSGNNATCVYFPKTKRVGNQLGIRNVHSPGLLLPVSSLTERCLSLQTHSAQHNLTIMKSFFLCLACGQYLFQANKA